MRRVTKTSQKVHREAKTNMDSTRKLEKNMEMSMGGRITQFVIWVLMKLLNILYIPLFIIRLFRKHTSLPPIDNKILLIPAMKLAEKIRRNEVSSVAVVEAFISRVKQINPILNAVIDDRFIEALEEAKKADALIASDITETELIAKYPLLGVPLTVKGSISIAGLRNSSGLISRIYPEPADAVAVQRARAAGAIPILTSNVPELCMNWETSNLLVGTTKNPYNTTRTVGGSSGGEAALLASAGSVLSIGSDIAGSLRLPAHFCSVFGHKPTPGVVSFVGHYPSCKNEDEWREAFTLGPMARYAADLRCLLQIIAEPQYKNNLQLDKPVNLKKIKIYYIEDTCAPLMSKVNSSTVNAINQVVKHLDNVCAIKCQKVKIPLLKYCAESSYIKLLFIDNVDNLFKGKGEGCLGEMFRKVTCRSNVTFMSIMYGVLRRFTFLIPKSFYQNSTKSIEILREEFQSLLGIDGVFIMPTYPTEAHYHSDVLRKIFNGGGLSIFNVLGMPVTNAPATFSSNGLPIGVQIAANPFCDRLTLAVAEEIEKGLGGWRPPSVSYDLS